MLRLKLARIWLASLAAILLLAGCSLSSEDKPPPSVANPSIYAGAQSVHETDETYLRIIDFVTSDSAGKVLAYYKNVLALEGWTFESDLSNDTREAFAWGRGAKSNVYEFTVTITQDKPSGQSAVELKIVTEVPK